MYGRHFPLNFIVGHVLKYPRQNKHSFLPYAITFIFFGTHLDILRENTFRYLDIFPITHLNIIDKTTFLYPEKIRVINFFMFLEKRYIRLSSTGS